MSNESILSLSDDVKASMRAYATMTGFLIMGFLLISAIILDPTASAAAMGLEALILVLVGTILAFLHKRDLFAIYFISAGFIYMAASIGYIPAVNMASGLIDLFLAIVVLLVKNEQRILVSAMFFISGIITILSSFNMFEAMFAIAIFGIIVTFYCVFAVGCERFNLPLRSILLADENDSSKDGTPVHFKISGMTVCIVTYMFATMVSILNYLGFDSMTDEQFASIAYIVAFTSIISGVIMLTAGRMRQTPFIFILLGSIWLIMACGFSSGGIMVAAICEIILSILIFLRSESRILLGLLVLFLGVSSIPTMIDPNMTMVGCALSFVVLILEGYIILALNSGGKLKLI